MLVPFQLLLRSIDANPTIFTHQPDSRTRGTQTPCQEEICHPVLFDSFFPPALYETGTVLPFLPLPSLHWSPLVQNFEQWLIFLNRLLTKEGPQPSHDLRRCRTYCSAWTKSLAGRRRKYNYTRQKVVKAKYLRKVLNFSNLQSTVDNE